MSKNISTCLWFDDQAEAAATFYTSIFKNARVLNIARYPEGSPRPAGTVMIVQFELDGQPFTALNGGPQYPFTPAVSLVVHCDSQDEVDHYWNKLSAGGQVQPCGWLQDRFGLSWQIVPRALISMFNSGDAMGTQRAFAAMLKMQKLDIATLECAFRGA